MKRNRLELVYNAMLSASPLPKWAQPDDVIRALEEIAADQECGLIREQRIWQMLPEWKSIANTYRCLETYDPIEALALRKISLESLLEHQMHMMRQTLVSPFSRRRMVWIERAIRQKCTQIHITLNSDRYREALRIAAQQSGTIELRAKAA